MSRKSELIEVSFKPAKGGIISETRTKVKRGGQGGGPDYDYETENGAHPDLAHAAAHLKSTMGHCFSGSAKTEEPADEE
jgi:hypothetical protein